MCVLCVFLHMCFIAATIHGCIESKNDCGQMSMDEKMCF